MSVSLHEERKVNNQCSLPNWQDIRDLKPFDSSLLFGGPTASCKTEWADKLAAMHVVLDHPGSQLVESRQAFQNSHPDSQLAGSLTSMLERQIYLRGYFFISCKPSSHMQNRSTDLIETLSKSLVTSLNLFNASYLSYSFLPKAERPTLCTYELPHTD